MGPFESVGTGFAEGVRAIKSQDGADLIFRGSSTLMAQLLKHGLVDEALLIVYPVVLGAGKRFFAEGTPARAIELVSTQTTSTGVLLSPIQGCRAAEVYLARQCRRLSGL